MNAYVQFSDATQSTVIAVFGCPQNATTYPNQGTIADTDPRYVSFVNPGATLAGAQAAAYNLIDQISGTVRLKYITDVPGQEMTYQLKAQDAVNYKAANYPSANIANYGWVAGYARSLYGPTPTAAQYQSACDSIINTQAAWVPKGQQIEEARSTGKNNVMACTTVADVTTALNNAIIALEAL